MTTPVRNANNNPDFDEIFERCLHAIERGQATVDSCTARFPEYRDLGAALRMALAVQDLPRPPMPAAFTAKTRQQLQNHLRAVVRADQVSGAARSRRRGWASFVRLALAVGIVALVLLGGFGVTRASANALPGDSLYPVKRVVESAELLFTGVQTQAERTGVLFHIAQTRLGELATLTTRRREVPSDFLADMADSVNRAYLAQPHTAQGDQLIAQTEQVLRLAASSGLISPQAADNAAARLVARSTQAVQTPVVANPTFTPTATQLSTPTILPGPLSSPTLTFTPTPTFTRTPPVKPTVGGQTVQGAAPTATQAASPVIPTVVSALPPSPTKAAAAGTGPGQPPVPTVIPPTPGARVPTNVPPTTSATQPPAPTSVSTGAATQAATTAATESATIAETATETAASTATEAATAAATATETPVPSRTNTPTRPPRPSRTPTLTRTPTSTPTATSTPTVTPTPTITSTPVPAVDLPSTSFKQSPQVGTFDNCPPEGQGGDPALNRLRNRTDDGKYQTVGLDTLIGLPWPKEVERKPRDQWPGSAADQVSRADGLPLTVEGYLIQVQPKGPDAQNCQSQAAVNWQLWIPPQAKGEAGSALIAQITPRIRANHANWTLDRLNAAVSAGLKVRVSGWLVLDPGQPDDVGKSRGTLWELTPVMQIVVSKDGQQWTKLDDYQP